MSTQLSMETMRVITDVAGFSLARQRLRGGDDKAAVDLTKTTSQLGKDLYALKPGQLTEVLEDARSRDDAVLRDTILDILKTQKKNPTAS